MLTFLSQIPRKNELFTFAGFFPQTNKEKQNLIISYQKTNLIFYESPNRIIETLNYIKSLRGNVQIALSRELTKLYEETVIDTIDNVITHYKDGIKGEIVCLVYAQENDKNTDLLSKIDTLKKMDLKQKKYQ